MVVLDGAVGTDCADDGCAAGGCLPARAGSRLRPAFLVAAGIALLMLVVAIAVIRVRPR
jgi:hypothetical protein